MVRISAIFIALCTILIAGSIGVVLFLRFGVSAVDSALIALGVLIVLAIYNVIAGRKRDRAEVANQVSVIARGSGDLARQVAEFGRRLNAVENKLEAAPTRATASTQPLTTEIEELSRLVRQLAESVAQHEIALGGERNSAPAAPVAVQAAVAVPSAAKEATPIDAPAAALPKIAAFDGLDRNAIIAAITSSIDSQRIDLHLQPIVTLPQRKVRYYEALSRLNTGGGALIAAGDFLPYAEAGSLLPKLDSLGLLRCVQVVRRLLLKNRDIGLFCNLAAATLTDAGFPQLLEFIEANRAIAPSLILEFTQSAVRTMGPIEHESLAALAERGFRFSLDNLTDLRIEPRELTARGFRFVKASAGLLLNRPGSANANIHPADFSDLLGRFGIDLIAERIETESTVVDLLDYDVRFGQGFLFSPPRPVRAEALQGAATADAAATQTTEVAPAMRSGLAQLIRAGRN
jgi:cyclic-di-GMP phosphodiesterase, flagellum assembly factor TipF